MFLSMLCTKLDLDPNIKVVTLVKVVSWKMKFWVNYDLEANLAYVMNINIVPFSILDVSKVFFDLTTISCIGHTWSQAYACI